MLNFNTETIYTSVSDSWKSLEQAAGLGRKDLILLNPHVAELEEIEAGIPLDIPVMDALLKQSRAHKASAKTTKSAYTYAQEELLKDVSQLSGAANNNERITLYHSTTQGGAAPDEVAWCSSFVNFCVEKSGKTGTDSKAARSWLNWGNKVAKGDWREGDVVVFWRESPTSWKGHVGFLVDITGPRPEILGGNQGDRLCIATPYPFSQILSVRRG